jgi:hypothetical protein
MITVDANAGAKSWRRNSLPANVRRKLQYLKAVYYAFEDFLVFHVNAFP